MTTNLDWFYENNRETLLAMLEGDCDHCDFQKSCDWNRCSSREWFEAEYEEPDTWEKLAADANAFTEELELYCSLTVVEEFNKLVARCKKLAEAEQ